PPSPPTYPLFPYTTLFRSQRPPARTNAAMRGKVCWFSGHAAILNVFGTRKQSANDTRIRPDPPGRVPRRTNLEEYIDIFLRFLRSEEHTSELQSRFDLVCR